MKEKIELTPAQKELANKLTGDQWKQRPTPNKEKALGYGLHKVRQYDRFAQHLAYGKYTD